MFFIEKKSRKYSARKRKNRQKLQAHVQDKITQIRHKCGTNNMIATPYHNLCQTFNDDKGVHKMAYSFAF